MRIIIICKYYEKRSLRMKKMCLLVIAIAGVSGCSGGFGLSRSVNMQRIGKCAGNAFMDPQTLIPLAGAVVFGIDDFDQRGSDWAIKHKTVFNTKVNADQASDDFLAVLIGETFISSVIRPCNNENESWSRQKTTQLALQGAIVGAGYGTIELVKKGVGRVGPDGWKDTSFPSGHTTGAFIFSTMANDNLNDITSNVYIRTPLQAVNILLAAGVGMGRVEGGHHYPSDVLAGAALGHFFTRFMQDLLIDSAAENPVDIGFCPTLEGCAVSIAVHF